MWTCDQVRDQLLLEPGGEPRTEAASAHLRDCPECHETLARVQSELRAATTWLAARASSDGFEERVCAAVKQVQATDPYAGTSSYPAAAVSWERSRLWLAGAVALLCLALVIVVRPAEHGTPLRGESSPDPAVAVAMPMTPEFLHKARERNLERIPLIPGDWPAEAMWWSAAASDQLLEESQWTHTPPAVRVGPWQRFVLKRGTTLKGRFVDAGMAPQAGLVAVLGRGALQAAGATQAGDVSEWVARGAFLLGVDRANGHLSVELRAPTGDGVVRFDARVDLNYSGSLLLCEPLALAVGLEQYEVPETVRIVGHDAWPALARLQVAGHDLPGLLPIDVLAGPSDASITLRRTPRVEALLAVAVLAENPAVGGQIALEHRGPSATANGSTVLGYLRSEVPYVLVHAEGGVLVLPHLSRSHARGAKGGEVEVPVRQLDLGSDHAPGTSVRVSRAWRGRTAITSVDGVALGRAAKDGSLGVPWWDAWPLEGVRALLTAPDGSERWISLATEQRDTLTFAVQVDGPGQIRVRAADGWRVLEAADLASWFAARKAELGTASGDLQSGPLLQLTARGESDWGTLQAVLLSAVQSQIQTRWVEFPGAGARGDSLRWPVPRDDGLQAAVRTAEERLRIVILPDPVRVRLEMRTRDELRARQEFVWQPGEPLSSEFGDALRQRVAAAHEKSLALTAELAPVTVRGSLPYAVVRDVLRLLEEAGVDRILLEASGGPNAALPGPR